MDIAFVSNVVYPFVTGGAQKRIHEIGTRLVERGHTVTIYGRHFWDGPGETRYDGMTLRAAAPSATLYEDEGRRSITEAIGFAVRLVPTLQRHIDEHDLVVASVFPYFPVLSSKLCTRFDTPLVTTWHEVWRDYWTDYLGPLAPFGRAVEHATAWTPQDPIAVSGVTADRLAEIGPRRERIDVVPNGIDVERIRSVRPAADGFDVLFAGRLIEDKHVDRLLRAFDRVASAHDATLGIVGDGPRRDALERTAAACDARHRITFLGFLDEYDDVLGQMKAASVFASPSTREGFGITYLEAMAAGCTVVGADHRDSAASEVIGDAGFVVDPTVDALADTLDRVLAGEGPDADPLAAANQYDWDAITARAEATYRRATD
jgi:glycosyltransferase involved in cell wall biosynthesis